MKRLISLITLILVISMLAACGSSDTTSTEQTAEQTEGTLIDNLIHKEPETKEITVVKTEILYGYDTFISQYEYDEYGNRISQTEYWDGRGNDILQTESWDEYKDSYAEFEYDECNRVSKYKRKYFYLGDPDSDYSQVIEYRYDQEQGLLIKREHQDGPDLIYETTYDAKYDEFGSIESYLDVQQGRVEKNEYYEYDEDGNVILWKNGPLEEVYSYKQIGDITRVETKQYGMDLDDVDKKFLQSCWVDEYDANGNWIKHEDLNKKGEVVDWWKKEYDSNGNCVREERESGLISNYEYIYDEAGNILEIRENGDLEKSYEYEIITIKVREQEPNIKGEFLDKNSWEY